MTVNNSTVNMLDSIIRINDDIYLPISDMTIVYNIKVDYIESTNRVVIDKLSTGMIKAIAVKDTDIKYRPRGLSKDVGTLKQGQTVNCFYTTSKGWRQIRTLDGIIGYVKANKLGDEYIIRQDMIEKNETIKIDRNSYNNNHFEISDNNGTKKVLVKNVFNIKQDKIEVTEKTDSNGENDKIWVSLDNKSLGTQTNEILQDSKERTNLIDMIVKEAIENDINGISIDFTNIQDKDNMIRFVIEITPKLREIGVSTCIVLNENMEEQDYTSIVDYIVE